MAAHKLMLFLPVQYFDGAVELPDVTLHLDELPLPNIAGDLGCPPGVFLPIEESLN